MPTSNAPRHGRIAGEHAAIESLDGDAAESTEPSDGRPRARGNKRSLVDVAKRAQLVERLLDEGRSTYEIKAIMLEQFNMPPDTTTRYIVKIRRMQREALVPADRETMVAQRVARLHALSRKAEQAKQLKDAARFEGMIIRILGLEADRTVNVRGAVAHAHAQVTPEGRALPDLSHLADDQLAVLEAAVGVIRQADARGPKPALAAPEPVDADLVEDARE